MRALLALFAAVVFAVGTFPTSAIGARSLEPEAKPSPIAAVIQVNVIPAARAASVVHELFPSIHVRVDDRANAVVVYGSPDEVQARSVVSAIAAATGNATKTTHTADGTVTSVALPFGGTASMRGFSETGPATLQINVPGLDDKIKVRYSEALPAPSSSQQKPTGPTQ